MGKIIKKSYLYAVGRRKTAVARVRLIKKGEGKIIVNSIDYKKYFSDVRLQDIVCKPLKLVKLDEQPDITIKVSGSGKNSQAEAVRMGISRIFVIYNKDNKAILKKANLLKRDSRKKERKKPGLKRARRAPQWSKR